MADLVSSGETDGSSAADASAGADSPRSDQTRPAAAARSSKPKSPPPLPPSYDDAGGNLHDVLAALPSWLVSMVLHIAALLVLAIFTLPPPAANDRPELVVTPGNLNQIDDIEPLDNLPPESIDVLPTELDFTTIAMPDEVQVAGADDIQAAAVSVELSEVGLEQAPKNDLLAEVGSYTGNELSGRGEGRGRMAMLAGASDESEKAVALALRWLAAHQMPDGGWSFNHAAAPKCHGQCRNPGSLADARNAATGLALLPFLGAGQTHKTGNYRETVRAGLYFLVNRMKVGRQGGSLWEDGGRMYSHGICAITLCEAYAMTHDKGLYGPAQQAIYFICYAQDPTGGGWRYQPRQRGDTSILGWQIMALKSGHMAYLRIPPITVKKAYQFLDTVQADGGAQYGYTDPAAGRQATTAVGLLCRMYLGWKKDNPALERGVRWISDRGPSQNDMYYNYYATQVMRHWEGELWYKWNSVMRDQLVNSQSKKGHETGSWYGHDRHGDRGGRLYETAMATMILEVYYRYLPIYGKQSTEQEFPLD